MTIPVTSILLLDAYKVGKIIFTTILGIRVVVLSHKALNGLDTYSYGKTTKEVTCVTAMYYCLPFIKNIIKTL